MEKVEQILLFLDKLFPNAKCELNYSKDYELLIAVMLSAQSTDKAVNKVTSVLFNAYSTLEELNEAEEKNIQNIIHSVGLSKTKAKNIKLIARDLIQRFHSKVPSSREDLMSLSGVGRKSANVVRIEFFKIPEIPVDTHVERVSKRLTLVQEADSVLNVELKLRKLIPEDKLIKIHHQLIFFGRYICKSQNPICTECPFKLFCTYHKRLSLKR